MSWSADEPVRGGYPDASLLALTGLDRARAILRKQMPPPPLHHLFGLGPVAASSASVTFAMPCSPWLQTDAGVFFAGTSAIVSDAPLGSAILTGLGPGEVAVTSDLSLNFLRPVDVSSEQLVCRARPIEVGRTLGLAEGLVEDGHGRLVAHCTTRCFVIDMGVPETGEPPVVELPRFETPDPYLRPIPEGSVNPERWGKETFVEILESQISGAAPIPPFMLLLGERLPRMDEEGFHVTIPSSAWFTSPAGTIYGGVLAYVADLAMTGAVGMTLARDQISAPLDLKVQYLRPAFPDGRDLVASGRVLHRGRTFATAQCEIKNADGKTVALAMESATIRTGRTWGAFAVADEAAGPSE